MEGRVRLRWMVVAAALVSGAPGVLAQDGDLPDADPPDPATCELENGWIVVGTAYLEAWQDAHTSGLIDEETHEALIDYMLQWDEHLTRTNDHLVPCLKQIILREEYGF
jgi:hypothetical protein